MQSIPPALNNNTNKRSLTPKSMPPTRDEHAKLKTEAPNTNAIRKGKLAHET